MKKWWLWSAILAILVLVEFLYYQFGLKSSKETLNQPLIGNVSPSSAPMVISDVTIDEINERGAIGFSNTNAAFNWFEGKDEQYLVGDNGKTLYTYDQDDAGVSNCKNSCIATWPPYLAATTQSALPADITIIERYDGAMQYAYKGKPLYVYTKDTFPGDTNGDGVGGLWHLVRP